MSFCGWFNPPAPCTSGILGILEVIIRIIILPHGEYWGVGGIQLWFRPLRI